MARGQWGNSGTFKKIDLFLKILCALDPQLAYDVMQLALQQVWAFMQRVIPEISGLFSTLESSIKDFFTTFLERIFLQNIEIG